MHPRSLLLARAYPLSDNEKHGPWQCPEGTPSRLAGELRMMDVRVCSDTLTASVWLVCCVPPRLVCDQGEGSIGANERQAHYRQVRLCLYGLWEGIVSSVFLPARPHNSQRKGDAPLDSRPETEVSCTFLGCGCAAYVVGLRASKGEVTWAYAVWLHRLVVRERVFRDLHQAFSTLDALGVRNVPYAQAFGPGVLEGIEKQLFVGVVGSC